MKEDRRRPNGTFRPERTEKKERPLRTAYEVRQEPKEEVEGQLEGRNALTEALRAGRTIDKVFIATGDTDKGLQRLAAEAKEAGAVVVPVDRRKLDQMSFTRSHQGVIALTAAHEYATIDEVLQQAADRGENALIVICDELTDPHNLGAILRTAECAGAHGVIIPKRRSVGLTATVAKAAAGAMEYMKVVRVTNINSAIAELKEKGVWVFGTAAEGSVPMYKADLTVPAAIVIGNEGDGMSPLVRKNCDVMVHIPMKGRISSLNASNAASILLYEAVRQRLG
jgi:23S rRNA (guanosine2251-2'-O)-methyltransferase